MFFVNMEGKVSIEKEPDREVILSSLYRQGN